MGFRARQPLMVFSCGGLEIREPVEQQNEEGVSLVNLFNPHDTVLPSPDMFDLDMLIKAKVDLQKTNTKIFGGDIFGTADILNNLTEENGESSNEQ